MTAHLQSVSTRKKAAPCEKSRAHAILSWFHADTILPMYEVPSELSVSMTSPASANTHTFTWLI